MKKILIFTAIILMIFAVQSCYVQNSIPGKNYHDTVIYTKKPKSYKKYTNRQKKKHCRYNQKYYSK